MQNLLLLMCLKTDWSNITYYGCILNFISIIVLKYCIGNQNLLLLMCLKTDWSNSTNYGCTLNFISIYDWI